LEIDHHIWYPFEKAIGSLKYKSFNKHEPTFENLRSWFKDYLIPEIIDEIFHSSPKTINRRNFRRGNVSKHSTS